MTLMRPEPVSTGQGTVCVDLLKSEILEKRKLSPSSAGQGTVLCLGVRSLDYSMNIKNYVVCQIEKLGRTQNRPLSLDLRKAQTVPVLCDQ